MTRTRTSLPGFAALALLWATGAWADLALDTAFGTDGIASVDPSPAGVDSGRALAIQPADGKTVIAGLSRSTDSGTTLDRIGVGRFNVDGTPDLTFGTGGIVTLLASGTVTSGGGGGANGVAIQDDGKIVVAGSWNDNQGTDDQLLLARFDGAGLPDPSFGTDGVVIQSLPGMPGSVAEAIAVQGDGSIVVVGSVFNAAESRGFVARFDSAGELDAGFATGGVYSISNPIDPDDDFAFYAVALATDGIVAAGGGPDVVLVKLTNAGSADTAFDSDGIAAINVRTNGSGVQSLDVAFAVEPLTAGGYIVAGSTRRTPEDANSNVLLTRVSDTGVVDTTFGGNGFVEIPDTGDEEFAFDVAVNGDGVIVVAGSGFAPTQVSVNGQGTSAFAGTFPLGFVNGLAVQSDGAFVAGGSAGSGSSSQLGVVRLTATAIADPDRTPDPFSFAAQTDVNRFDIIISDPVTITGIDDDTPITITGGVQQGGIGYGIGCGDIDTYVSSAGTIDNGETVCVAVATPSTDATDVTATLTIGTVSADFTVTTGDGTPDAFSFAGRTDVAPGVLVSSDPLTVTGITVGTNICVASTANPTQCIGLTEDVVSQYSLNCTGTYTSEQGLIEPGDTVCLRHRASGLLGGSTTTGLLIGGVAGTFTSSTRTEGTAPGSSAMDPLALFVLLPALLWSRRRR